MHRIYLKREMQLSMNALPSRHFYGSTALVGLGPLSMLRILERIKTHHTLCRIPLGTSNGLVSENSDNTQHSSETVMHAPGGFEPAIPTGQRPQTHAFDRAVTGIGLQVLLRYSKQGN